MIYVLYHGNCYDGFGAAFACWKKFGKDAQYIACAYGKPPPEMPDASICYIVDFSFSKEDILKLAERMDVVVLDHHKTAEENLRDFVNPEKANDHLDVIFDMTRSGALITWQYLFPGEPVPHLIQHISDRDLWEFKIPGSREIHKALVATPFDFEVWDKLDVEKLKVEGAVLEKLHDQLVEKTCKGAFLRKIAGHLVYVVNTSFAWSEVGDFLLKDGAGGGPFVASFTVFEDEVMWSLRSRGEFDVSEIAKKYGGGGHKNAAGFKSPRY